MSKRNLCAAAVMFLTLALPASVANAQPGFTGDPEPAVVESASANDCPENSVCFYTQAEFFGTLVYYKNPLQHTCSPLPRYPARSVINATGIDATLYSDLECGAPTVVVKKGQARDVPSSSSWR
ncbi:peptidase inhibitor family I36 protein [Saccharopolyspora phatthalungensis]|uniref:Peptidase inhibitor family I36 n=1 Tax=Saccharopolyspora phatthalungensis TaxID=664693 RepID=A0A840PXT1_9PSEU|nr:peptidase inhibitor family I36 protein [Saccharopolyspora phatthalungensis]MBB5153116.1 hypothetical protein [Saccharopolyspora phatthalungensis]